MVDEYDLVEDLVDKLLEIIENNDLPTPTMCREYAHRKLDFTTKKNEIFL